MNSRRMVIPLLLLVAGAALAAGRNEALSEQTRQTLQNARSVGIVVEEDYRGGRDEAGQEPLLPEVSLPLANVAVETLAAAGIKCVPTDKARVVLKVMAHGRAIGRSYIGAYLYSGANLGGSIEVQLAGQTVLRMDFGRTVWPPSLVDANRFPNPSAAPFAGTMGGLRQGLLQVVGRVHGPKPLLSALSETEPEIATAAADALGEERVPEALPELITALAHQGSPNEPVRRAAAIALARLRDARALPALITALKEDEEKLPELEKDIAPRGEFEVVFALPRGELEAYGVGTTRQCILGAIAAIGAPDKTARLLEALRDHSSAMRRSGAALLLSRAWEDPVENALAVALKDPSFAVRAAATSALAELPAPSTFDAIHALARNDPHPFVRDVAEHSTQDGENLAARGFTLESLRRVARELRATDPHTRLVALGKLSDSWPHRPRHELLLRAARDESPEIRAKTYALLAWDLSFGDTAGLLFEATRDPNPQARKGAINALTSAGALVMHVGEYPEYFERLMELLASPEEDIRQNTVAIMGQMRDARAVDPLAARLRDPAESTSIRKQAATSLGYLQDPRAIEPLLGWLEQVERMSDKYNPATPYAPSRHELIRDACHALRNITTRSVDSKFDSMTASEWRKWLAENPVKPPPK